MPYRLGMFDSGILLTQAQVVLSFATALKMHLKGRGFGWARRLLLVFQRRSK